MTTEDADLLYGVPAIAAFLKVRKGQAYHLIEKGGLPVFRLGRIVCSRQQLVTEWLAKQGAAASASGA